ncbi:unnamed protein product [Somion occarium]
MTKYALSKGDIAVATLRKPEVLDDLKAQYPAEQLLVVKLDVTKPEEVANAFTKTKEVFGRLDIVFNNAAFFVVGEVESTPEDVARSLFETNFWGASYVTREAIGFFRDVNKPGVGGRLLQISSQGGFFSFPGVAYYGATKYALEGLSQGLAGELDPEWNIKITIVEPGEFDTKVFTSNLVQPPIHPAYATKPHLPSNLFRQQYIAAPSKRQDPNKAVIKLYELASLENPPLRLPIGKDAIGFVKDQLEQVARDRESFAHWSDDLE